MTSLWMPQINHSLCTGCGECVTRCPVGALGTRADRAVLIHPELCTYCSDCEDVCPVGAIEVPYLIVNNNHGEETKHE